MAQSKIKHRNQVLAKCNYQKVNIKATLLFPKRKAIRKEKLTDSYILFSEKKMIELTYKIYIFEYDRPRNFKIKYLKKKVV